jgi:hypothetical protein
LGQVVLQWVGTLLPALVAFGNSAQSSYRLIARRAHARLRKQRLLWRLTAPAYKAYEIGWMMLILYFFSLLLGNDRDWLVAFMYLGASMFFLGFVVWLRHQIPRVLASFWGVALLAVLHALLFVVAGIWSRHLVARALGLPPQSFEGTVDLIALATYVISYLPAGAFVLSILFASGVLFWFLYNLMLQPQLMLRRFLPLSETQRKAGERRNRRVDRIMMHALGSCVTAVLLTISFDRIVALTQDVDPAIRRLAYAADFHPAGRYPGVSCFGRIRLLENGVVVIARPVDGDIAFEIGRFNESGDLRGCMAGPGHGPTPQLAPRAGPGPTPRLAPR